MNERGKKHGAGVFSLFSLSCHSQGVRFLQAKNFSCTFTGNDDRVSLDSALKLTSFDLDQSVNEEGRQTISQ